MRSCGSGDSPVPTPWQLHFPEKATQTLPVGFLTRNSIIKTETISYPWLMPLVLPRFVIHLHPHLFFWGEVSNILQMFGIARAERGSMHSVLAVIYFIHLSRASALSQKMLTGDHAKLSNYLPIFPRSPFLSSHSKNCICSRIWWAEW